MKLIKGIADFFKTMWKFYSKSWFFVAFFFVVHAVTLMPWLHQADTSIWIMRGLFLLVYAGLHISRYFMVKNSEEEAKEFTDSFNNKDFK